MKYLDERIICTLSNLTIPTDGLYRYDVIYDNDVEAFIGNCFISKGDTSKSIDITDIVRNWYDFSYPYNDTEFQREWQVKLYLNDTNTVLSDSIGIYPIYRYPNRKARMETPLSNNGLNWYMPALQGFNSDKKGEFLPHIPFIYSDKVDYNLAVNIGNLSDANPYLYTGVKKELKTADFGIYNTQYKLSELWKGNEVETLDWIWDRAGQNISSAYEPPTGYYSFVSLAPLHYKAYVYAVPAVIYDSNSEAAQTPITTFPFVFDAENTGEQQEFPIDLYIQDADANGLLNIYPEVDKSCKASVHCEIKEDFANDYTLIERVIGDVTQTDDYWFIDIPGVTELNITLKDGGTTVRTVTVSQGSETFSILDTESISSFEFLADTTEYTFYLDQICSAGNGFEYIFNFVFGSIDIKIYPLKAKYEVDATFRTYRVLDVPLTQDNITIQNDGTDNLTASDRIRFVENKQTLEAVYGNQELQSPNTGKQIVSKLTNSTWSYAIVDKTGKLLTHNTLAETIAFPVVEGDFELYIFAISGAGYEVTKITTKDFGITKNFQLQFLTNNTSVLLIGWNAVLNNSPKYQQYVTSKNIIEVAKVDPCPARYYLQWRDRYGSMMQRAFTGTPTPKINYTNTEIKNYQSVRRLASSSSQLSFELNSGWIKFEMIPYYESIFCSPYLKLYDTQEDQVYDVIVKENEYIEKTFKNNDRQLYSLKLTLEENKTQDIVY